MGYMGVGIRGVNPLPAGTGGTLWYYSPQSGVKNFPKKLTFLRLNDLVNFHNFIFPQKIDFSTTWHISTIFIQFHSEKNWHFPIPTPSYFIKASRKNFSRNFSNFVHTIKKSNFQFYFFCFINETPKKFFHKIFKNSQTPYRNERSKNYRKKLKIIFLLIFILCNVTQNYHNRKSVWLLERA